MIEEQPPIDIAIIVVWIDMLAGDNEKTANSSAKIFQGKSILQFHDPHRQLGKTIAESFGLSNAIAWDAYLFYGKDSEWTGGHTPTPFDWVHQLDDPWASPDHHAWDDDLVVRLREITTRLIGN